ncbi:MULTISPECIES: hypothetical protein [Pseudovibrio]|uniref:cell division protein FtsL n=1 Tax=Stappiaceae TaxID=2821832 RepID=UPI0023653872|nr:MULTISPECIES: hypothetical protein [Pseudovibrio]MDD7910314.1 hypothetical protein [Pseudovibrio exalbescens]MDX5594029.1 hypothetical protein [Pseudovibrio sp. SPO723]
MLKIVNLLFLILVVIGAAAVYDMKMSTEHLTEKVAELQRQIEKEKEDIRWYKAQWSALNQPSRLQGVVDRYNAYLELEPLGASQITTVEALPVKPVQLQPVSGDPMGGYASRLPAVQ